jgi:hypothetical protein
MVVRIMRVSVCSPRRNELAVTEDFSASSRRDEKTNMRWGGFGLS